MKYKPRDYTRLTETAKNCGMMPYKNKFGQTEKGIYTLIGLEAPVDLSACAEDEMSILRTAVKQLSEQADESYHYNIERNLSE